MTPTILAGNRKEAEEYLRSTGEPFGHFRFVDDSQRLRGLRGVTVIRTGSWGKRTDLAEIEEMALVQEITFVDRGI